MVIKILVVLKKGIIFTGGTLVVETMWIIILLANVGDERKKYIQRTNIMQQEHNTICF